jgi:hypothetical protein
MIERFLHGLSEKMEDPDDCFYMTVVIPGDIDPLQRHHRFSVYIDAELRLAGLGCSMGGGTLFYDTGDDDEADGTADEEIAFCILDVDATDVDRARALLRIHLPELGVPAGTLVQWEELEDRFDGARWHLAEPRSIDDI